MIIFEKNSKKKDILSRVVSEMGGSIEEFIKERNSYVVSLGGKKMLLEHHIAISREPYIGVISTKCKDVTSKLLVDASLPVIPSESFYSKSFDEVNALKRLNKMSYPIILKHAMGSNSQGLFVDIQNSKQAIKILKNNLKSFGSMIAQKMVYGREYRVLVLNNKVIAALEMIHPYVVGDGTMTLRNLIKTKQNDTDRRTKFDRKFKHFLKSQGVSLRDVLPDGKTFIFKQHSCLAEGGETKDVTDVVHKDVVKMAVNASKAVGKHLVGIDIICKDISKKQSKKALNILEINGKPDVYIHYNPSQGEPRNVLEKILKFMIKK